MADKEQDQPLTPDRARQMQAEINSAMRAVEERRAPPATAAAAPQQKPRSAREERRAKWRTEIAREVLAQMQAAQQPRSQESPASQTSIGDQLPEGLGQVTDVMPEVPAEGFTPPLQVGGAAAAQGEPNGTAPLSPQPTEARQSWYEGRGAGVESVQAPEAPPAALSRETLGGAAETWIDAANRAMAGQSQPPAAVQRQSYGFREVDGRQVPVEPLIKADDQGPSLDSMINTVLEENQRAASAAAAAHQKPPPRRQPPPREAFDDPFMPASAGFPQEQLNAMAEQSDSMAAFSMQLGSWASHVTTAIARVQQQLQELTNGFER